MARFKEVWALRLRYLIFGGIFRDYGKRYVGGQTSKVLSFLPLGWEMDYSFLLYLGGSS